MFRTILFVAVLPLCFFSGCILDDDPAPPDAEPGTSAPVAISSVLGNGSAEDRFTDGLIITGRGFTAAARINLLDEHGTLVAELSLVSVAEDRLEAALPLDLAEGKYIVQVTEDDGTDTFALTILRGERGPAGTKGDSGERGLTGPVGAQGAQGPRGDLGPMGGQGPMGSQGLPGTVGPTGTTGANGMAGAAGPAGPAGEPGSSIVWLGEHAEAPAEPAVNEAYYDAKDNATYLWNGSSWDTLASGSSPLETFGAYSGHFDTEAEAFTHWDGEGSIPAGCAKCHSTAGYLSFLGADGTEAGVIEAAAPTGQTLTCFTCHSGAAVELDHVLFPSGTVVTDLGPEARCMTCHQGRESTTTVDSAIASKNPQGEDAVTDGLSFRCVHYLPAGATLYGTASMGGYQYAGRTYDTKFAHVTDRDSCVECHDQHTLKVKTAACLECHPDLDYEGGAYSFASIRMTSSNADYDGDGDVGEGIHGEILTLRDELLAGLRAYVSAQGLEAIGYNASSHPYFFVDTNGNGTIDATETTRYTTFTPRLLRATYNYQYTMKDLGGFAHNAKYVIQLLIDSLADLGTTTNSLTAKTFVRNDPGGHFDGTAEGWAHYRDGNFGSSACSRCHSADGFLYYTEHFENRPGQVPAPAINGLSCEACHTGEAFSEGDAPRRFIEKVVFPSGTELSQLVADEEGILVEPAVPDDSFLCLSCHQGRESGLSQETAITEAALEDADTLSTSLAFRNVHYLAAGAVRFGAIAKGGYEYSDKRYDYEFGHVEGVTRCTDCHAVDATDHDFALDTATCLECHEGTLATFDPAELRMTSSMGVDYDGDGELTEGIAGEIATLEAELLLAMQAYAAGKGAPIGYYGAGYPYFFNDTNANGVIDAPAETSRANGYKSFTPRLVRVAYNYQFSHKDPGGYAHNGKYLIQLLVDSLADLGVTVNSSTAAAFERDDLATHFNATAEGWWHYRDSSFKGSSCNKCHSADGFSHFVATFETLAFAVPTPKMNGLRCDTCHDNTAYVEGDAPRKYVEKVIFPNDVELLNDQTDDSFLCMTCHQGRESGADVTARIAADTDGLDLSFLNPHYLPAGAILQGAVVGMGFQYPAKIYDTAFAHAGSSATDHQCASCHTVEAENHTFEVEVQESCTGCHDEATPGDPETIRKNRAADYDGDGSTTEALSDELEGLEEHLLNEIKAYALGTIGTAIAYGESHPYFFVDTNGNGAADPAEMTSANAYKKFDAALLEAAFNYKLVSADPGAWAHNTLYSGQLLFDSIEDLSSDAPSTYGLTRP